MKGQPTSCITFCQKRTENFRRRAVYFSGQAMVRRQCCCWTAL